MKRTTILLLATVLATLTAPLANATLIFDISGRCDESCDRLGIAPGSYLQTGVLGLADGTDMSEGALLRLGDIESFNAFGIDFLSANSFTRNNGFTADGQLGGFVLSGGTNSFCYHIEDLNCGSLGFDTDVDGSGTAMGGFGHGPAQFTLVPTRIPEPGTLALLTIGLVLVGFGLLTRKKE